MVAERRSFTLFSNICRGGSIIATNKRVFSASWFAWYASALGENRPW